MFEALKSKIHASSAVKPVVVAAKKPAPHVAEPAPVSEEPTIVDYAACAGCCCCCETVQGTHDCGLYAGARAGRIKTDASG